jgi:hypothetical protein
MKKKFILFCILLLSLFCFSVVIGNHKLIGNTITNETASNISLETRTWDDQGTAVCLATGSQEDPEIVAVGNGSAIIAWQDKRYDINIPVVFAQKINILGQSLWTQHGIQISEGDYYHQYIKLSSDGTGGAIIVWGGNNGTGTDIDLFAQRVDSNGVLKWGVNGTLICNATSLQSNPEIIYDGQNGAIISWIDYRNTGQTDIYAQRINSTGHVQWTENGIAVCTAANDQNHQVMVSDNNNGTIIAWEDQRNGNADIYAQRINSAGSILYSVDGSPICTEGSDQTDPTICSDGNHNAIIAWQDMRSGQWDIYAAKTHPITLPWITDGVPVCTYSNIQQSPKICPSINNSAIITWEDYRTGSYSDIYAQLINSTGHRRWSIHGKSICIASLNQLYPDISRDGLGGAFITWEDRRSGNSYLYGDVYANRVFINGTVKWNNGLERSTADNNQGPPKICAVTIGNAMITWEDDRAGPSDSNIYVASLTVFNDSGDIPGFDFTFIFLGLIGLISLWFMMNQKKLRL